MLIVATQKFTRQTPRKLQLVANSVRKLPLVQALEQLAVIERKATVGILKVVRQAIANGVNNHGYKFEDLQLKNILVTEGSRYKRFRAVSRGRGHGVIKRTSHIRVELEAGVVPSQPISAVKASTTKSEDSQIVTESVKQPQKSTAATTSSEKTASGKADSKKTTTKKVVAKKKTQGSEKTKKV